MVIPLNKSFFFSMSVCFVCDLFLGEYKEILEITEYLINSSPVIHNCL